MQMRLNNPTSELPDWIEVSPAAKTLFSRMAGTPLSSKPAVSKLMGHSDPYSNPLMDELAGAGLVASVPLGALTDRADRYFMSPFGLQFLSPSRPVLACGGWPGLAAGALSRNGGSAAGCMLR